MSTRSSRSAAATGPAPTTTTTTRGTRAPSATSTRTAAPIKAKAKQAPPAAPAVAPAFLSEERGGLLRGIADCVGRSSSTSTPTDDNSLKATVLPVPTSLLSTNNSDTTIPAAALLWHVPSSVDHPLRSLVGPAPFVLATAVPQKRAPTGLVSRKKKKAAEEESDVLLNAEFTVQLLPVGVVDVDIVRRNESQNQSQGQGQTLAGKTGGMVGTGAENSHGNSRLLLDSSIESNPVQPTLSLPLTPNTHTPLPMQAARYLLSLYSMAVDTETETPRMFAFASMVSGEQKFVGIRKLSTTRQTEFEEQRTAFVYDICADAPVTATFPDLRTSSSPSNTITIQGPSEITTDVSSFLLDFQLDSDGALEQNGDQDGEADREVPKCEVQVRYDVVVGVGSGPLPSEPWQQQPPTSSNLSLHLSYNPTTLASFPSTPLSLPFSEPSSATLEIGYVPYPLDKISHSNTTARMWKEWKVLRDWSDEAGKGEDGGEEEEAEEWKRKKVVAGKGAAENVDRWLEALKNEGGSATAASTAELDEEFLAVLDEYEDDDEENNDQGIGKSLRNSDPSIPGAGSLGRKDLDFTERVWNFLLSSQSKTDLQDAMTALIDSLETGTLLPPVSKHNPTPLAKLVRDCIRLHSLRTASSTQTESLQSYIESGFDSILDQLFASVCALGLWKMGRDARSLLSGIVDPDILDLLLANPVTKVPYGCSPDSVPAVSEEELETLPVDPWLHEIRWSVRVLEALWRALELFRFVTENAIGVPQASVKRVVAEMLSGLVAEANARAQVLLQRDRGQPGTTRTIGVADEIEQGKAKGGMYKVGLQRVSVATSKFISQVAKSFKPSQWSLTLRSPASGPQATRSVVFTQRRDPEQVEGLFAAPQEVASTSDQDALLDDVQDLTIAGPAFARSAGASVGGLAYGAGDDVDRIVYDITLANGYLV